MRQANSDSAPPDKRPRETGPVRTQPFSKAWQRWLLALLLILLVLTGMAWTNLRQDLIQATPTPGTVIIEATPGEVLPPYVGQDFNQMTPIILGGAILIVIILAGTLGTARRRS